MDIIKKDIVILFEIKIKNNLFLRFTYTISYHPSDLYDFKELKELIITVIQKYYTVPEWKTLYNHGKTLYRVRQQYLLEFDESKTFFYRYENESFIQMKDRDRIKDYENYQFFMQIENKSVNKD